MNKTPLMNGTDMDTIPTYVTEKLFTDTLTYEVVKTTAKTITIRQMRQTDEPGTPAAGYDTGAYGLAVMLYFVEADPEAPTKTVRLTKDGFYCVHGNALRPATLIEGRPVRKVDHRF